ncbi:DUF4365 domain-containing protein [Persicimonas caeni]|uniref:DUF4365 domain-containing protein n=1 Tax=Persicimonas caeni TaxID=2292766 RepID=A0A4Y6PUR0_PERCE|nr:DUF4365 domain-containing protein [Persicimonas caeni]QDG52071.1 DUF4365 domain-containing protein [Persicimonas caeni]QED33292.1 DUF4365 domain-containing protein [Persicimonas caeni]
MSKTGDIAEDHFRSIVTRAGFECHRPAHDRRGWDFILEFPENIHVQFDASEMFNRAVEQRAFVQVKGTRSGSKSMSVALQHWERFAKDSRPCFFYVLEIDDSSVPQEAYLIHVGEHLVGEVAKRLANLAEDDVRKFRKLTKNLNWSRAEPLDPNDHHLLSEKLRAAAGTAPDEYADLKREWLKQAGVSETFPFGGTAAIEAPNREALIQTLNDFYLGQTKKLELAKFEAFEQRFGSRVRAPEEMRWHDQQSEAWVELGAKAGNLVVSLAGDLQFPPVKLPVEIYSNAWVVEQFGLERADVEFRASSPCLDFRFGRGQISLSLSMPESDDPIQLSPAAGAGRVLRLMNAGARRDKPLNVKFDFEDGVAASPEIELPPRVSFEDVDDALLQTLAAAFHAQELAQSVGLKTDDLAVRPEHLLEQSRALALTNLLHQPQQGHLIQFSSNVETNEDWTGEQVAAALITAITLDKSVVVTGGVVRGVATVISEEGEWPRIKVQEATPTLLLQSRVFPREASDDVEDFLAQALDHVEHWTEEKDIHLVHIPDFVAEKPLCLDD